MEAFKMTLEQIDIISTLAVCTLINATPWERKFLRDMHSIRLTAPDTLLTDKQARSIISLRKKFDTEFSMDKIRTKSFKDIKDQEYGGIKMKVTSNICCRMFVRACGVTRKWYCTKCGAAGLIEFYEPETIEEIHERS
jgi:hypothetical protein